MNSPIFTLIIVVSLVIWLIPVVRFLVGVLIRLKKCGLVTNVRSCPIVLTTNYPFFFSRQQQTVHHTHNSRSTRAGRSTVNSRVRFILPQMCATPAAAIAVAFAAMTALAWNMTSSADILNREQIFDTLRNSS